MYFFHRGYLYIYIVGVQQKKARARGNDSEEIWRHLGDISIFLPIFVVPTSSPKPSMHCILICSYLAQASLPLSMMENLVLATCGAVVVMSHCWNHGLVSWNQANRVGGLGGFVTVSYFPTLLYMESTTCHLWLVSICLGLGRRASIAFHGCMI